MQSQTNSPKCLYCLKVLLAIVILVLIVEYNSITWRAYRVKQDILVTSAYLPYEHPTAPKAFLVWSNSCHMPNVDPFSKDSKISFKKLNYSECSDEVPLTKLEFDLNSRTYNLRMKDNVTRIEDEISCCYQSVIPNGGVVDNSFKLQNCVNFSNGYLLPKDVDGFIVNCKLESKNLTQKDAYFLVREKPEVRQKLNSYKNRTELPRPVSVVMFGIDTMSRFNLRRVMPETTRHLLSGNWFELSGYNKIDDNTFPNLMAVLTGLNRSTIDSKCNVKVAGGLVQCNLIWDRFRNNGYATAYAEDETWMSTFNYSPKGFKKPPVDYYHRPFMSAIEKNLKVQIKSKMKFCVGLRHSTEYIYDFGMEFASRFKGEPYFGLFWTNTFTHNSFSDASGMDDRIVEYLMELKTRGILDDSIVFFFSDHGSRFGKIRSLKQGFLDERLPFIFVWLPPWFRAKNPKFVEALKMNRYRLTSSFDIYMTLQHVLEMSGRIEKQPNATSCPRCQSIFFPMPVERTCRDAGIADHWCTCVAYENVPTKTLSVVRAANSTAEYLNSFLKKLNLIPPCSNLEVSKIKEAQMKVGLGLEEHSVNSSDTITYRIRFSVHVKADFEASVVYSKSKETYSVIDNVSRLDAYGSRSECISNKEAKKYCVCTAKGKS